MPKVIAVCISDRKGISKSAIECGILKAGFGLVGDAHAGGEEHREVSLLAIESIQKMNASGFDFKPGDFAENITTSGMSLVSLPIGTTLRIGDEVVLEIAQIGKKCHTKCAIYREAGKCIMPKEGVFARVIRGGPVKPEDGIMVL